MSSRPLFQHFQTRYREGKYKNKRPVYFNRNPSWQILPRTQNGRQNSSSWEVDSMCSAQLVYLLQHRSVPTTLPHGWALWYPEELKTYRENCCRHCFKLPNSEAVQMAFETNCSMARKWNAAQWEELNSQVMNPRRSLTAYQHMREDTLKGWKRKTHRDSNQPRGCQGIREEAMNSTWGCFWVMKPFCTILVDTGCCTLGFVTSDNNSSHLWRLPETMHTRKLFKLLPTVLLLGYFLMHLKHVLVCMFQCTIQTSYWLALSVQG